MFRMIGKKVELYRFKIVYTENEIEIQENCISIEHRDEIEQMLADKKIEFVTAPIIQTGNEWFNGLEFDSYDEALIVFNSGLPKPQTIEEKVVEQEGVIDNLLQLLVDKGVIY